MRAHAYEMKERLQKIWRKTK